MKIQNLYKCENYTPDENLNKTCRGEKRCLIYYDIVCNEYKEKGEPAKLLYTFTDVKIRNN